jgi:toxin ParE1/3/4
LNPATLSPQARRDLLETTAWIAHDNPVAARAYFSTLEDAAKSLSQYPETGIQRPDVCDAPVRFLKLTGFPHIIIYDSQPLPPLILRVLHGAQDLPDILKNM